MKRLVVGALILSLVHAIAFGQSKKPATKRGTSKTATNASTANTLRICQGVPIPDGYAVVAYEKLSSCPHGAYVLKKDDGLSPSSAAQPVSRPRKVETESVKSVVLDAPKEISTPYARPPQLEGPLTPISLDPPPNAPASTSDEVGEGDVVRIDTNLVTVPVSVLDRQGRFISDLRREQFSVFENGVEQKIAYFEPTDKPFTVALLLDTSGSTFFHLWEIKEAAISFAKQLRPQDRVLVVTFDNLVMLLTEATNDSMVVTEVIQRNAITGFATRLYDALDLVIKQRLNKIEGRKAIVLFTDGVDTASYQATYKSTLHEIEELDALIYPVQYDTTDFGEAQTRTNTTIVTTTLRRGSIPIARSSREIYGTPPASGPGTSPDEYKSADRYLHQLADKTGGQLYQANDHKQLSEAFSRIAEQLRHQYSLGYYPQTTPQGGERREIRVHVAQPDVAVRARDSYVQRVVR